jgi:hypothetical protein
MPTAAFDTYTGGPVVPFERPELASVKNFKFPNSGTVAKGTIVGELTATPGSVKTYADANVDGSGVAKYITMYDVTVDASGNHAWGGGQLGEVRPYAPCYIAGYFLISDLTGLDAAALADPGWRLVHGSVSAGEVALGL